MSREENTCYKNDINDKFHNPLYSFDNKSSKYLKGQEN
jgi:hypothetical protein